MSKSAQRASAVDRPESFQLKGGLFPMTLLELKSADLKAIKLELMEKVTQSPAFFQRSPLVFGVEQLTDAEQESLDLEGLCVICRELTLLPTATRGANARLLNESGRLGLAILPRSKGKQSELTAEAPPAPEAVAAAKTEASPPTRIITTPIRSGQQIYARGGDLVVMASVSAGAEVLADGNIHIYGALRGRALAGVQGDENARIFCSSQEAELVAVAGQFMVDEVLRTNHWKDAVQIYLAGGRIQITPLPKHN
ncbi:MAG: septum site-determining protein MinC [Cellvibrionaceae bacterium]|nr:septum site-determining protein MinC [Cellvibrionaceae bacterium]